MEGCYIQITEIAEDELTEAQCGFTKGRGCARMIFVLGRKVLGTQF